jgi:ribonuclease T1
LWQVLPFFARWERILLGVFSDFFDCWRGFIVFSIAKAVSSRCFRAILVPLCGINFARFASLIALMGTMTCGLALAASHVFASLGPEISEHALPAQGVQTYRSILSGGPFPFEKDGVVFGNRERVLPPAKRGYYREYTVRTPGQRNRGPQRIVCGGLAAEPDACYYTADHYATFRKIVP